MKRKQIMTLCIFALLLLILSTTAFAIDESEVESAIAASSQEDVAGNVFIWFLCAVAFLKISQKIDSFMSSLGINVGRTGGSMLAELMIAGRALGGAVKATGGAVGGIFNRNHTSNSTTNRAAGQAFTGGGSGLIGVAQRAAGNAAASSATGRSSGISNLVGGAMLNSSMKSGGKFASDVVGAVATGNIASVGSITGKKAAQALTSYLGYDSSSGSAAPSSPSTGGAAVPASGAIVGETGQIPGVPLQEGIDAEPEDTITPDGGTSGFAATVTAGGDAAASGGSAPSIPTQAPQFRNVEIGGGRITGYETPADGGTERQFAMYNVAQYMEPSGSYEIIQTTDGESWYKQYAEPTVQKTPYKDSTGKIKYSEKIVDQMPQIPKRKDRV